MRALHEHGRDYASAQKEHIRHKIRIDELVGFSKRKISICLRTFAMSDPTLHYVIGNLKLITISDKGVPEDMPAKRHIEPLEKSSVIAGKRIRSVLTKDTSSRIQIGKDQFYQRIFDRN